MLPELDVKNVEEDECLMEKIVLRHASALEEVYHRYKSILKSVVMQVIHDDAEADDVIQDVFIQVWDRANTYSVEKGKLINWLATLARRRAIDRVRQHAAYRRATDRFEIDCNIREHELYDLHTVENTAQTDDLRAIMASHIQALPIQQQQAIYLTFFEGKSQREISSMMGMPLGTVKTRIELGVKKLRKSIFGMRYKLI